jgi:uncharacterized protein (TIGR00730 family)
MKRICVFCGSSPGADPRFAEAARTVGTLLGREGLGLVYGGGNVGLMGIVADAALSAGAEVIGVIPGALVERELAHADVKLIRVATMHERKQKMHDLSDGFLALPGGFGTLDELFEALTWAQLGVHAKPCALLDVAGYFTPLLQFIDGSVRHRFVRAEHRALLLSGEDPVALLAAMRSFRPAPVEKWIDRGQT